MVAIANGVLHQVTKVGTRLSCFSDELPLLMPEVFFTCRTQSHGLLDSLILSHLKTGGSLNIFVRFRLFFWVEKEFGGCLWPRNKEQAPKAPRLCTTKRCRQRTFPGTSLGFWTVRHLTQTGKFGTRRCHQDKKVSTKSTERRLYCTSVFLPDPSCHYRMCRLSKVRGKRLKVSSHFSENRNHLYGVLYVCVLTTGGTQVPT
jgi:hypothetical protein